MSDSEDAAVAAAAIIIAVTGSQHDRRRRRRPRRCWVFKWKRSMRMKLFYNRRHFKRIFIGTLFVILAIFFFVFIIVPVIFRYSYSLQRSLLFLNFGIWKMVIWPGDMPIQAMTQSVRHLNRFNDVTRESVGDCSDLGPLDATVLIGGGNDIARNDAKGFISVLRRRLADLRHIRFGFRKGLSTTHALIKLVEEILDCFEDKSSAAVSFCDLSRAFDCVSHDILLAKLKHLHVEGPALELLSSYLRGRVQYVSVNGDNSRVLPVECGVPQGSVLGPVLFLIMIDDLSINVPTKIFMYADDTTVLNKHKNDAQAVALSERNLESVQTWLNANELFLNKAKTTTSLECCNEGVKLGVWHILPSSKLPGLVVDSGILNRGTTDELYNSYLAEGQPIFIYHHGNAGNRASKHRLELYKLLQKNNYHIVAFDYRSYGDSSAVDPDETGVVSDAKAVYKWVRSLAPNSNVFLWGHSLGTGVASHSIHDLEAEGNKITGLILEAPFTNLQEEIRDYPMSRMFKPLPWFDFFFVDPTYDNGLRFQSDVYLLNVTAPIMILHAEDDNVVPVHQGINLYQRVKSARGENGVPIKFVKFAKSQGYGHDHISRDKGLTNIIS
ncbi:uncharacterized protein LOC111051735 [Nilaparvata lugens]|uniref:uncharacterized protein LOC111051735 n=1 Tax=Nilaparvata lugens TaxID=108931 RepID=UPI00193E7C6C|nr:uncharacterized protein LOC111051735 [Nilaparvata lugens]